MLAYMFSWHSLDKSITNGEYFTKKEFINKTILSNKMDPDMFKAHYYNPTLKLIPSCSIGWFENKNPKMKELYVKLQDSNKTFTEEELKELIDYTNSDFYIHYIRNRKQKLSFDKLISLGIIPIEINQKKILFKVKK
jgi:beta-N-acetylglucosaminidase